MSYALTIFNQILVMFILAGIGYLMFRAGKISMEGSKNLGNILIFLSLPCVTINNLSVERTPEKTMGLIISSVAALAILLMSMLVSRLTATGSAIDAFGGSFSNPGFFGIPVITASLAPGAVFYIAPFMIFLNLFQWTYGVELLKASDENSMIVKGAKKEKVPFSESAKKLVKMFFSAPIVIGAIIGLFFFITGLSIPTIPARCVKFLADLNTPLAMFTVGVYLAQTDIKRMFTRARVYKLTVVRMILIPIITIAMLSLAPASFLDMKYVLLIASACPVGSNIAVYAQLHHRDYAYSVETCVITTLFSIVSMPLLMMFASVLWG